MKVLLDEDLPHKLRLQLTDHEVSTAAYLEWSGLKNGVLLKAAEEAGFEALVTGDQNLNYQQNLTGRKIALLTLSCQEWRLMRSHINEIAAALKRATPGSFQFVHCGEFRRR
jgi:hypothetical protein